MPRPEPAPDVGAARLDAPGGRPLRLGLVADTHIPEARAQLWPQVFAAFEGCDAILHGGDIHDLSVLDELGEVAPVYAARGNGDEGHGGRRPVEPDPRVRDAWVLEAHAARPARPVRIGLIHDLTIPEHPPYLTVPVVSRRRFGVDPDGPGGGLDAVVYGDTHVERIDTVPSGVLCVNPGSPTFPRNLTTQLGTIGFLEIGSFGIRAWISRLTEDGHEKVADAVRAPVHGPEREE